MSKNYAGILTGCCAFGLSILLSAHADQINMQNGDRFIGRVITLSNDTVVVQSDVLGTLLVPRSKIAAIMFGTNAVAPTLQTPVAAAVQPAKPAAAGASANQDLSSAIQQLRADTNVTRQLQQQVQQQLLAGADPKATEMFNQMMNGLMNGSLNVDDIRAQAKSAADQLRAAKKEFGSEAGFAIDGYLAVLDGFLRESENTGSATNALAPPAKLKRSQSAEEE